MHARWLPAALFLGFFAGMGWPARAEEPPAKRFRIGIVAPAPVAFDTAWAAVEKELRARGYVEGKNLDIDFLLLGNDAETYPAAMAKLARHDENAILIRAPEPALRAAIATTRSVPLVIVAVSYDPLASGYISSLAHPGGNVTGVFLENVELAAKRIDLLKQAVPKTTRLVVLYDAAGKYQLDPLQSAASVLGLSLDAVELRDTPYDYERALAQTDGARGDAMMTLTSPVLFHDRERLAEIAAGTSFAGHWRE